MDGNYTNATASLTDVDDDATGNDNMAFPIGSNEQWIFRMNLQVGTNTTADAHWAITAPASATCDMMASETETASSVSNVACGTDSGNLPSAGTDQQFVYGSVLNSSTAGSVQLQYRQDVASGTTTIFSGSFLTATRVDGADLAEIYFTNDSTIDPGTVVIADPALNAGVQKSRKSYEKTLVGVISTKPGLIIGKTEVGTGYPINLALSGRVPVKVTSENGPIRPGDPLTSASTPGFAMRATKAGAIIGQALTGFDGEGQGMVEIFIKGGYGYGSSVADLIGEDNANSSEAGKLVLEALMTGSEQLIEQQDLSEIFADRVVAGLEIITPKVTTDKVALNSIEAATAENIQINSDVVVNGTLVADKIRANQIEGLEVLANQVRSSQFVVGSEDNNDGEGTVAGQSVDLNGFSVQSANVALDLSVGGLLTASGGLTVNGLAQFNGESIFDQLVTFEGKSLFNGDAEFAGRATFNSDSGGFAVIRAGQNQVRVAFERPYSQVPVVTVNIKNGQFVQYAYKDLTEQGFTIVLKDPATSDIEFAWTALSVNGAKTSLD